MCYHHRNSPVWCTGSPAAVVRSTSGRRNKVWRLESRNTKMPATEGWRRGGGPSMEKPKLHCCIGDIGVWPGQKTQEADAEGGHPDDPCWGAFQLRRRTRATRVLDHGSEDSGEQGWLLSASGLWSHVSLMCKAISSEHFRTSLTFVLKTTRASSWNDDKLSESLVNNQDLFSLLYGVPTPPTQFPLLVMLLYLWNAILQQLAMWLTFPVISSALLGGSSTPVLLWWWQC